MKFGREMLALVELLRQIAPSDSEMENPSRRAALIASAAMPDVSVDDGDGSRLSRQLDFLGMRRRRILRNNLLILGPKSRYA